MFQQPGDMKCILKIFAAALQNSSTYENVSFLHSKQTCPSITRAILDILHSWLSKDFTEVQKYAFYDLLINRSVAHTAGWLGSPLVTHGSCFYLIIRRMPLPRCMADTCHRTLAALVLPQTATSTILACSRHQHKQIHPTLPGLRKAQLSLRATCLSHSNPQRA